MRIGARSLEKVARMKKDGTSSVDSLPDYLGLPDSLPGLQDTPPRGSVYGVADWIVLIIVMIIFVIVGFICLLEKTLGDLLLGSL